MSCPAPVSYTHLDVYKRQAVDADPAVVNRDAYGEGWLVKVKMSNPAEYDTLLGAADYEKLIG